MSGTPSKEIDELPLETEDLFKPEPDKDEDESNFYELSEFLKESVGSTKDNYGDCPF